MTENGQSTLWSALLKVQAEIPKVAKEGKNPAFRSTYVTLDKLMEAAMPVLNRNGLVWTTFPGFIRCGGEIHPNLTYRLLHVESGREQKGTMPLLLDKQNPQGLGSALTYAKRQSLMAVVGIVGEEDDDGNLASKKSEAPTQIRRRADDPEDRTLKDEELQVLLDAVKEAKANLDLLLASVGAESANLLTVRQGREILRKLKT